MATETPKMDFRAAYALAGPRCCAPEGRCEVLFRETRRALEIEGDMAELGVWRGGTAAIMAAAAPGRRLYLYDTFAGMPAPTSIDLHGQGDFDDTSLDGVAQFLRGFAAVEFRPGTFPWSIAGERDRVFSCVHLDGDLYESTRAGLEFFWPRLAYDGALVIDDFGWWRCQGVARAIGEYFGDEIESLCVRIADAGERREDLIGSLAMSRTFHALLRVSRLDQAVIRKWRPA